MPSDTPKDSNAKTAHLGGVANSSIDYGKVMQEQYTIKRRVHILACTILGLDDSDHEDDEAAEPLEKAISALIESAERAAYNRGLDRALGAVGEDELEEHGQYGDTDPTIRNVQRQEFADRLDALRKQGGGDE